MRRIAPRLSKMHQEIHKKSLLYTLRENKVKVKNATKILVVFTLITIVFLLVFALTNITKWYAAAIIIFSSYILHLCYKIFALWQTHKKIKQKLKTL